MSTAPLWRSLKQPTFFHASAYKEMVAAFKFCVNIEYLTSYKSCYLLFRLVQKSEKNLSNFNEEQRGAVLLFM